MRIILLGAPGAGKGTIATSLKESLGLMHISTGDILREEMKKETDLGEDIKKIVESGALVPDEIVTRIIENKLTSTEVINQGYLLDGFPRTKIQAGNLDKIFQNVNTPIDNVLYLKATLPVVVQRLTGRRVCRGCGALFHVVNKPSKKSDVCDMCGGELYKRSDDNEETIKNRMEVYLKNTMPIVDYYQQQGKLKEIDADQNSQDVYNFVMNLFVQEGKIDQDKIKTRN